MGPQPTPSHSVARATKHAVAARRRLSKHAAAPIRASSVITRMVKAMPGVQSSLFAIFCSTMQVIVRSKAAPSHAFSRIP